MSSTALVVHLSTVPHFPPNAGDEESTAQAREFLTVLPFALHVLVLHDTDDI